MTLTLLFWNINRNRIEDRVGRLAARHNVDIIVLAEHNGGHETVVASLAEYTQKVFVFYPGACERLLVFANSELGDILLEVESSCHTMRSVVLYEGFSLLLGAVHLPSRLHWSLSSINHLALEIARDIRTVEMKSECSNTIVIGDFTLSPFDNGMVSASGFNAVMTKEIAVRGFRTVQGQKYPFFYNPLWGRFGDTTPGPAGTYYYTGGGPVGSYWYIYDQVLVRPSLIDKFSDNDLLVLIDDGGSSLVSARGMPDNENASDHFPVIFSLHL